MDRPGPQTDQSAIRRWHTGGQNRMSFASAVANLRYCRPDLSWSEIERTLRSGRQVMTKHARIYLTESLPAGTMPAGSTARDSLAHASRLSEEADPVPQLGQRVLFKGARQDGRPQNSRQEAEPAARMPPAA